MPFRRRLVCWAGMAALGITVCPGQMKAPEAPRQAAARESLDQVKNWAAPLYWRRTAANGQAAQRTMRPDALGRQGLSPQALSTTSPEISVFVAVPPCRLLDTRVGQGFTGAFGPPSMVASTARTVPVPASTCGVPAAVAYSVNITAVPAPGTHTGYVKAWPDDEPEPNTAVLNDTIDGAYIGESAIVPAGADGGINVLTQTASDLVIDINGYFADPSTLPMALGAGSAVAPALTFGGDPMTGLYAPSTDTVGFSYQGMNILTMSLNGIDLAQDANITKNSTPFLHDREGLGAYSGSTSLGVGFGALAQNSGSGNTAAGFQALGSAVSGTANTAIGTSALSQDSTGYNNTAAGFQALGLNSGGYGDTAVGSNALLGSGSDNYNTAIGYAALQQLNGGSSNTALGATAGYNVTGGSNNILIANAGVSTDTSLIRIGDIQKAAFIAGIRGATTGNSNAVAVVIDSAGQLGTVSSSRKVKRDVADMGDTTETLMSLRPVQFRYATHGPDSPLQYGLIAEEVAEVASDLVARKPDGEVETVFYDKVNAMLLNEVQKLHRENESLKDQNQALGETLRKFESRLAALEGSGQK